MVPEPFLMIAVSCAGMGVAGRDKTIRGQAMNRLSAIIFIILAPVLAGSGALIPLSIYGVADFNFWFLVAGAGIGALLAIPGSIMIGKRLDKAFNPDSSAGA